MNDGLIMICLIDWLMQLMGLDSWAIHGLVLSQNQKKSVLVIVYFGSLSFNVKESWMESDIEHYPMVSYSMPSKMFVCVVLI